MRQSTLKDVSCSANSELFIVKLSHTIMANLVGNGCGSGCCLDFQSCIYRTLQAGSILFTKISLNRKISQYFLKTDVLFQRREKQLVFYLSPFIRHNLKNSHIKSLWVNEPQETTETARASKPQENLSLAVWMNTDYWEPLEILAGISCIKGRSTSK